jgi:hypothetical protein
VIVRTTKYVCNRCKVAASTEVSDYDPSTIMELPPDWARFRWGDTDFDLCPECSSDAQTFLNNVEAFSHVDDNECPMHVRCEDHGFFHGAEATELREGIEKILESGRCRPGTSTHVRLEGLLASVDARDSLAYAEMIEKEKKQCAGS